MGIPAVSVASAIQATTVAYCSRWIVKSSVQGLDLAIQAERSAWSSPPRQAVGGGYTILPMGEKVKSGSNSQQLRKLLDGQARFANQITQ